MEYNVNSEELSYTTKYGSGVYGFDRFCNMIMFSNQADKNVKNYLLSKFPKYVLYGRENGFEFDGYSFLLQRCIDSYCDTANKCKWQTT